MKLQKLGKIIRTNRSIILSCLGIGGFVYGTINAVNTAYEAGQEHRTMKVKEFIPTIISDALGAALILTGNVLDKNEKKMLAAGYALLTTAQQRYLGKKTEETDSIARKAAKDLKLGEDLDVCHYFYDPVSDQVFYTDMRTVVGAEYLLNQQIHIFRQVDADLWPWLLGIEVTDEQAINLIGKGWERDILYTLTDSHHPGIQFEHDPYDKDYVVTLPDGSTKTIPGSDILEIVMSYYPKNIEPMY